MINLYKHNEETNAKLKNVLQLNNKTCIIQPTGSGKSYLILKLIEDYVTFGRDIIVIEPQKYIFEQLQKKMEKYELISDNVKFLTYSALGKMNNEKIQEYQSPKLVIVDEMHRAGAPKWRVGLQIMFESFPNDCKYVGLSATPIRFLDGKRNMAEELFDNCIANEIGLADAILNRILPLPRYIAGLYTYDNEVNAITRKIQNSRNTDEEKKQLLEEVVVMKRNLDKSKGVSAIFKKYIDRNKGKYVAFCRNINHLKLMKSCLEQWFSEADLLCNFYEVHCKNQEKDKQFNAFMNDTGLSVCLSVAMLSEGVHGIDGVILLRDTISPNLYYQQIGRVFAVDMDTVPIIFDLVANCESIMDCNLKNDLLDAVEKRDRDKVSEENCTDGEHDREEVNNSDDYGTKKITKEDIESFFIFDQVIDSINIFKSMEKRLVPDWEVMFQTYCMFYEENGHGNVPFRNGYERLFDWCYQQRRDFHNKVIEPNRKKLLDEKGFIWSTYKYRFLCMMKEVKNYLKKNGHYPNSNDMCINKELVRFIKNERKSKKDAEYEGNIYPEWKMEVIKNLGLYDFFGDEREIPDLVIGRPFRYATRIGEKEKQIN